MLDEELDVIAGAAFVPGARSLPRKLLARLAVAMMVVTATLALGGLHLALAALLELVGWAMFSLAMRSGSDRWRLRSERQRVKTDGTSLRFGERTVALSEIALAYVQPDGHDGPTVCCEDARGALRFQARVPSDAKAEEVLAAVEHGRRRRRWRLGLRSELVIGADGIFVSRLAGARFVPWSRVMGIDAHDGGMRIRVHGEPQLDVTPRARRSAGQTRDERAAALLLQLRLAQAAWKKDCVTETTPTVTERLTRRDRSVTAWHADLLRLDDDGNAYRATPLRTEELWRVVADVAEPEETRAAAAVALRGRGDAGRLRVVAEDVASPRLRVVLERAADADAADETLAEALGALDVSREGAGPVRRVAP